MNRMDKEMALDTYRVAVGLVEAEEYVLAMERFRELIKYPGRIFGGKPPAVYLQQCHAILHKRCKRCPYCGCPII